MSKPVTRSVLDSLIGRHIKNPFREGVLEVTGYFRPSPGADFVLRTQCLDGSPGSPVALRFVEVLRYEWEENMFVYIESERSSNHALYTVGYYATNGEWVSESDYNSRDEAAARCNYLNGGGELRGEGGK